jgi:hypothetical protein
MAARLIRSRSPLDVALSNAQSRHPVEGTTAARGGGRQSEAQPIGTLVHERLEELAASMPDVAGNVGPGWDLVLDKLTAVVRG